MEKLFSILIILSILNITKGSFIDVETSSCFHPGECIESKVVDYTFVSDEFECLQLCAENVECGWFTFSPTSEVCYLFENCSSLQTEHCQECLSGVSDCLPPEPKCSFPGKCLDNIIYFEEVSTRLQCLELCKSTKRCRWYTFNTVQPECILFSGCDELDESSENFVSGERRCNYGFSKIMVAIGYNNSELDDVEVIDLSPSPTICQNLPNFPRKVRYAAGGFGFQFEPIICGGYPAVNSECFSYKNGAWKLSDYLNDDREGYAITRSPFNNGKLFATGGYSVLNSTPLASTEFLTEDGWVASVDMPVQIMYHCMVYINSSSIMVIAGYHGNPHNISSKTFIFNSETQQWSAGPDLGRAVTVPSCALINRNDGDKEKSIIVIGGEDINIVPSDSTDILDMHTFEWHKGPSLPFVISHAAVVEDHFGGVILIGGVSKGIGLDTIFHLAHAGENAQWVEMPQKLKTPRWSHTAFWIPGEIADCH